MSDKYILDGHEAVVCDDLLEWARWLQDVDRLVAKTDLPQMAFLVWLGRLFKSKRFEPVKVSTVFLGLNHNLCGGPPELFETMIFGGEFDEEMWRYSTWDEAEKGHQAAVKKVSSKD